LDAPFFGLHTAIVMIRQRWLIGDQRR
jgi:hypothetical protein